MLQQNRFYNKGYNNKQRRAFNNDKQIHPTRGYNSLNIYTHDMGVLKYIKQILTHIKEESNSNTTIVEDFKIPLTSMNR